MTPKCACQVKPVELFTRKRRLTKKVELKVDSKMRPEISPFRLVYGRLPFATLENKFPWPKERPEPVNVFLSCWKIEKKLTGCRVVKDLYPNQLVLVQRKLKKKCEIMVYPTVWNHGLKKHAFHSLPFCYRITRCFMIPLLIDLRSLLLPTTQRIPFSLVAKLGLVASFASNAHRRCLCL